MKINFHSYDTFALSLFQKVPGYQPQLLLPINTSLKNNSNEFIFIVLSYIAGKSTLQQNFLILFILGYYLQSWETNVNTLCLILGEKVTPLQMHC